MKLSLSRIEEWIRAWCPKGSLKQAIMFQSLRPMPSFGMNFVAAILFFSFVSAVVLQGFFGIQRIIEGGTPAGLLHLLSVPLLCLLGYLFIRWFSLRVPTFDLNTMIPLTFGLYAINRLFGESNAIFAFGYTTFLNVYEGLLHYLYVSLLLLFDFLLLWLSHRVLKEGGLGEKTLRVAVTCLVLYGAMGILAGFRSICSWNLMGLNLGPYDWISLFFSTIDNVVFLLLAVDVHTKRSLRHGMVYAALLSIGTARLIGYFGSLPQNLKDVYRYFDLQLLYPEFRPEFYLSAGGIIHSVLKMASHLLVILVSSYLLRKKPLERGILKLSVTSILIYASSYLISAFFTIYYYLAKYLIPLKSPVIDISLQIINLLANLNSLAYIIPLFMIGLSLYRKRTQWSVLEGS